MINFFANQATTPVQPRRFEFCATPEMNTRGTVGSRDSVQLGGTYVVRNADSLWGIAKKTLGDATRWPEIFALNKDKIKDPDLIFPGTTLRLPPAKKPGKPVVIKPQPKPTKPAPVGTKPEPKPANPFEPKPTKPAEPKPTEPTQQKPAEPTPAPVTPPTTQKPADPQYPTVGEYVKGRIDNAVDDTLTGLHGAAEIAFPPLLLGEIAAIKAKHKKAALDRVWDLPMDPQGKWKEVARKISDEESAKANAEIRALPGVRAISAAGEAIGDGVVWTGRQVAKGADAVLDAAVDTGVAIGKGVEWTGQQIEAGARAAGRGIVAAGDAVVDGAVWVGKQAVEAPKAAARGVLHGVEGVGSGLVRFSKWALGGLD